MHANRKLWLLFLWRLESEKGFDLICELIEHYPNKELPFELYVFGTGSYEKKLLTLAQQFKEIHFFGRKPLSEVERYLDNIDYCLMPSRFLETFGLSAINVLKWWIPVIGFKKWGLIPFIPENYAIEQQKGNHEAEQLANIIQQLVREKEQKKADFYQQVAKESKAIANNYSKEQRIKNFQKKVEKKELKKIVMVSDFINKVGGIETYIYDVKELLELHGYEVKLFGNSCPRGWAGKVKKLLGIGIGSFNLWEAIRLYFFIRKEKPDLIWYHSMLRRMGWMPLRILRNHQVEKWMMYHDFGYFTPYPHQLYDTKALKFPLSLKHYLQMAETKNPIKLLLICGKYFSLSLLRKQLKKQIDLHLVPSEFMVPIVEKSFKLPKDKIQDFNHFIQE